MKVKAVKNMWISKKEYKFLKENAEKNIDAECAFLKKKYDQGEDAIKTLKECANTLKPFSRLLEGINEVNLNFYHAYYKKQYYDEGQWKDTFYNHQGIVVIANSYDDAKIKVEKCLSRVEEENYRMILISDIVECIGLDLSHGFEDSFYVYPICN